MDHAQWFLHQDSWRRDNQKIENHSMGQWQVGAWRKYYLHARKQPVELGLNILFLAADDWVSRGKTCRPMDDWWYLAKGMGFDNRRQEIGAFWTTAWALRLLDEYPATKEAIFSLIPTVKRLVEAGKELRYLRNRGQLGQYLRVPGVGTMLSTTSPVAKFALEGGVSDGWLERGRGYYRRC